MAQPFISVIIPTCNRKGLLLPTLDSLAAQTYPADRFEVMVVDDGGNDGTEQIAQVVYPFKLVYCRQTNQGSALARNYGMERSRGEILVFVDDDTTLDPGYLASIARKTLPGVVAMGVWQPYEPPDASPFCRSVAREAAATSAEMRDDREVPFSECTSNNLAVCREDFVHAGMWRDVLGDGPTLWGDVEFGYRAWKQGRHFVCVADAKILHRDRHIIDLSAAARRAYHVSRIVQPLFQSHPEIRKHIPMFRDKGPIVWHQDPPSLILRKLARQVASSRPAMWAMERAVPVLERRAPESRLLALFYRWIISGYICRGYRKGLREQGTRA